MKRHTMHVVLLITLLASACRPPAPPASKQVDAVPSTPSDRVAIPANVRKNLGITFAKVELREVAQTIRVPGSFELSPEARREYRTMASGRIELHVRQYQQVQPGDLLYELDSPDWRALQQQLSQAEADLKQAQTNAAAMHPLKAAHERHHEELEASIAIWQERVEQLAASRASGVVSDEDYAKARSALVTTRVEHAETLEKEAELLLREQLIAARIDAQRQRLALLLDSASSLLSLPVDHLGRENPEHELPRWRTIRLVQVRAEAAGVVDALQLTNGAWADQRSLVLTTVDPQRVRFRALGMQADLPGLANGADAWIAPPRTPGIALADRVGARWQLGLDAHPDDRTIALIAYPQEQRAWMRLGVAAFLEVVTESSSGPAFAIPRSAIVKDGIMHVFFCRNPDNPDQAIRVEADLGVSDGRWVVIQSGLARGDEIVLDGAYELKLATAQSGFQQKGGHFHADGSFHGDH